MNRQDRPANQSLDQKVAESGEQFPIPFENIREVVEVTPDQLHTAHGRRMIKVREEVYDAIRLGEVLNLPPADPDEAKRTPGILVHAKDSSFCLLVDRVLGHRQVVASSLRETLPDADKMAGVAQLGGGRLALVLSIAEVIKGVR